MGFDSHFNIQTSSFDKENYTLCISGQNGLVKLIYKADYFDKQNLYLGTKMFYQVNIQNVLFR